MIDDPIVEEVHSAREQIWEDCVGNWSQVFERWETIAISHPDRTVDPAEMRENRDRSSALQHGFNKS